MSVTIYHNPRCSNSRNALAMIRQSGVEPEIILYLENPLSSGRLKELVMAAGLSPRDVMRSKDRLYEELGLEDPNWSDQQLIDFMIKHPSLINRPIVVTPKGVRLCRPPELVLDILENPEIGPFAKENGQVVIDEEGRRLV